MNGFHRITAALLLGLAGPLPGAYLESDGNGKVREVPAPEHPEPIPRPIPGPCPGPDALSTLFHNTDVGRAYHHRGLTVFPLVTSRPAHQNDIVSFDEARRRGWIELRERDDATVGELSVVNNGSRNVLMLSGAIVVGGKQNRMVRQDVLLPPRRGPIPLQVYCVEQERWAGNESALAPAGTLAHPQLRKAAAGRSSQDAIWQEVSKQHARADVSSESRDYQTLYEDRIVISRLQRVVTGFRKQRPARTIGIAVAFRGRIIAADLFSDPTLFSDECDALLQGYAIQHLEEGQPELRRHRVEVSAHDIEQFLNRALNARRTPQDTPGTGQALRLSGAIDGTLLNWRNRVVHAHFWP